MADLHTPSIPIIDDNSDGETHNAEEYSQEEIRRQMTINGALSLATARASLHPTEISSRPVVPTREPDRSFFSKLTDSFSKLSIFAPADLETKVYPAIPFIYRNGEDSLPRFEYQPRNTMFFMTVEKFEKHLLPLLRAFTRTATRIDYDVLYVSYHSPMGSNIRIGITQELDGISAEMRQILTVVQRYTVDSSIRKALIERL
jgi:hypothetical protein